MKTIIAVVIMAMLTVPVSADGMRLPQTVAEFVKVLEAQEDPIFYAWVTGYIWGVDAGLYIGHPCYVGVTDPDTKNKQMVDIFLTFANQHKDKWEEPNALHLITAAALMKAFPCPEPKKSEDSSLRSF